MHTRYIAVLQKGPTDDTYIVALSNMILLTTKVDDIHVINSIILTYRNDYLVSEDRYRNISDMEVKLKIMTGKISHYHLCLMQELYNTGTLKNAFYSINDIEKEVKNWASYNINEAQSILKAITADNEVFNLECIDKKSNIDIMCSETTKCYMIVKDKDKESLLYNKERIMISVPVHMLIKVLARVLRTYNIDANGNETKKKSTGMQQRDNIITPTIRSAVLHRNRKCLCCGKTVSDGVKLEIDHIIPLSMGGKTEVDNLQTLCSECNRGKGTHTYDFLHETA